MAAGHVNVKISGEVITDTLFSSVSVMAELNHHGWCHIECRYTEDQRSTYPVEDWLGEDLQFLIYDSAGAEHVLFDGFVTEVELEYEIAGDYTAHLTGATRSYKMDLTPRHAYYMEKPLSGIAQQLAGNADLESKVNCKDRRPLNYVQWGESDFEFLRRLADDHKCWMRPAANGIEIFDSFQQGTKVQWRGEIGENGLLSFVVKGTLGQPSFNGAHYNPHEMKSQTYTQVADEAQFFDSSKPLVDAVKQASKGKLPPGYLHHRSRVVTLDEYKELLKKESVRSIAGNITGHGTSRNPELCPGNTVEIEGALDAHGTYGVTRVVHSWTPQGYQNEFTCTPWQDYTDPHPPEMKPWCGVVPARVMDHNDPKKMGRIQVQYFWQEDGPAHWARMMTPHAGADRGFMFMPEKGDEVLVGFEDGDPERPYILGCVWNGVDMAPRQEFWGDDIGPNDVKRIVTKSGNRVQMVDVKGKESIVLSTPNSAKLSLFNKAPKTGRNMIVLHADDGDIFLSAPKGRIHFHSQFFSREICSPDTVEQRQGGLGSKDQDQKQVDEAQQAADQLRKKMQGG